MRLAARLRSARAGELFAALLVFSVLMLGPTPGPPSRAAPTVGKWDEGLTGRLAGRLAGRLLVASKKMGDVRFAKTVIFMVQHSPSGAIGLVVNSPMGAMPAARLFERLGLDADGVRGEIEVYFGGPVDPDRGTLLHSTDVLLKDSVVIDNKVALTALPDMLRAIARGEGPAQTIFTMGYSGWGPGQLESELARDDWFVIPADMSLVFAANPTKSWERAVARRSLDL